VNVCVVVIYSTRCPDTQYAQSTCTGAVANANLVIFRHLFSGAHLFQLPQWKPMPPGKQKHSTYPHTSHITHLRVQACPHAVPKHTVLTPLCTTFFSYESVLHNIFPFLTKITRMTSSFHFIVQAGGCPGLLGCLLCCRLNQSRISIAQYFSFSNKNHEFILLCRLVDALACLGASSAADSSLKFVARQDYKDTR